MPKAVATKSVLAGARSLVVCATVVFMAAACTTEQQARQSSMDSSSDLATPAEPGPAAYQPVAFPMPADSKIDHDGTLVVGGNKQWFGTLALSTNLSVDDASAYYSKTLPSQGWETLSSLVSNRVVLQFVNRARERACIVTIEPGGMFSRTHVEIVVAPLVASSRYADR